MPKLGSLFDGSGGFPLAGELCGLEPVWASEIEPYPIAVTRSRFPGMKHLGDISKVNGAEIEPVDVISFGSPCQDLSIAGKRAGLRHEDMGDEETTRSGLFMEAVRVIKEMRGATDGRYPTFAIWENVPGAFSSNRGEDFRVVLEELIQIVEPSAAVPPADKNGWPYEDIYMGPGWSLAYRVLDAQFWGVPQRRRRIYLVIDLRGERAGEILFEREGLRGYFEAGRTPWAGAAADAERGAYPADPESAMIPYTLKIRSGCEGGGKGALWQENISATLATNNDQYLFVPTVVVTSAGFKAGQGAQVRSIGWDEEKAPPLTAEAGGNSVPSVCIKEQYLFENHSQDARYKGPLEVCPMLPAQLGTGGNNQPIVVMANGQGGAEICEGKAPTLSCNREAPIVFDKEVYNSGARGTGGHYIAVGGPAPTLRGDNHPPGVCVLYTVRRLTPTECARLQGFPDKWGRPDKKDNLTDEECQFWTDVRNTHASINGKAVKEYTKAQILTWYNKLHTDSAEYRMWGNGIALPTALYVIQGVADALEAEKEQSEVRPWTAQRSSTSFPGIPGRRRTTR